MGGGIGMGNTCKPMAVLFQCMTKFTTNKKKKKNQCLQNYPSCADQKLHHTFPREPQPWSSHPPAILVGMSGFLGVEVILNGRADWGRLGTWHLPAAPGS